MHLRFILPTPSAARLVALSSGTAPPPGRHARDALMPTWNDAPLCSSSWEMGLLAKSSSDMTRRLL